MKRILLAVSAVLCLSACGQMQSSLGAGEASSGALDIGADQYIDDTSDDISKQPDIDAAEEVSAAGSKAVVATAMTSTERTRILNTVGLKGISKWVKPTLSTSFRRVTTVAALRQAITDANAGKIKRVVLGNATYTNPGLLKITRSGVQVVSENLHGAIIKGQALFVVENANDVLLMGMYFQDIVQVPGQRLNVFYLDSAERVRITRNRTARTYYGGTLFTVDYNSHDAQFDFNQVQYHCGLVIGIKSPGTQSMYDAGIRSSKRAIVIHNEFRDIADPECEKLNVTTATENGEVIMMGLGYQDGPDQNILGTFEYNLMERALGDEEGVSVKSNGNKVRFNVMRASNRASYNVRGGHDNELNRNILEDGTKHGVGIAGSFNVVSGNDIEAVYPLLLQYAQTNYLPTLDANISNNRFRASSYLIRLRQSDPVGTAPARNLLQANTVSFTSYRSQMIDASGNTSWTRFKQLNTVSGNTGLPQ